MGKISKALEKAGKENVVRPVERPATAHIKPTRKKPLPAIEQPAVQMDQHPLAAQPDRPHAAVEPTELPRPPAPSAPVPRRMTPRRLWSRPSNRSGRIDPINGRWIRMRR